MINKLVLENLKHRWVRTFLSALVVGVQVMSILTLIGLSRGLLQSSASRIKGSGADILLKPGTEGTFSLSTGQIPQKYVDFVGKQPGVKDALGVLTINISVIATLNGVDIAELEKLSGPLRFYDGGPPVNSDDIVVDDYYAKENNVHTGQTVTFLNHHWHVCGIIQSGVLGRLMVKLSSLQNLTGNIDKISEILVKVNDPADTNEEVARLNQLLRGNLTAISTEAFLSQFTINNIPQLRAFVLVITILSVIVGFLVVFLSMYTAVVERTREIGILKALGAKPLTILDILVREAIMLAVFGWAIGVLLAFVAKTIIITLAPASLPVVNTPDWWPKAAAIALGGALLGAVYPGLKAARHEAIEALSYE